MFERCRILLVDDEPSLVKIVAKRLEFEGFAVSVAIDGEEAVQKIQTEKPDLVILDVMLPKLSGYDVCRQIKQDPACQKIPVILFTAKILEKDERLGLDAGADAYVRKPFRAEELLNRMRELLPSFH